MRLGTLHVLLDLGLPSVKGLRGGALLTGFSTSTLGSGLEGAPEFANVREVRHGLVNVLFRRTLLGVVAEALAEGTLSIFDIAEDADEGLVCCLLGVKVFERLLNSSFPIGSTGLLGLD